MRAISLHIESPSYVLIKETWLRPPQKVVSLFLEDFIVGLCGLFAKGRKIISLNV